MNPKPICITIETNVEKETYTCTVNNLTGGQKMDSMSMFDLLDDEVSKGFRSIKSTDWKWTMANDYPKEKNGLKVFSCFACGGGSTMGYKLAGCEVLGCCEIDPKMNEVYVKNHKPKYNYLMDIIEFNKLPKEELPEKHPAKSHLHILSIVSCHSTAFFIFFSASARTRVISSDLI